MTKEKTEKGVNVIEDRLNALTKPEMYDFLKNLKNVPNEFKSKATKPDLIKMLMDGIRKGKLNVKKVVNTIVDGQMELIRDFLKKEERKDYNFLAKKLHINSKGVEELTHDQFLLHVHSELLKTSDFFNIFKKLFPEITPKKTLEGKIKRHITEEIKETKKQISILNNTVLNEISKLNHRIKQMDGYLGNLNNSIQDLTNIVKIIQNKMVLSEQILDIPTLIKLFQKENLKPREFNSEFFSLLQSKMKQMGWKNQEIINSTTLVAAIGQLLDITERLTWDVNLEEFYQAVIQSHKKFIKSSGSSVIAEVRRDVCKMLNISTEKFNEKLLQGRDKNWFTLSSAAPLGVKNPEFLVVGSNKFYYLKLRR